MTHPFIPRLAACACLCLAAAHAGAADYPVNPVSLVVGYGAGGGTDVCNRILAQDVAQRLGQPMIVENKPGPDPRCR